MAISKDFVDILVDLVYQGLSSRRWEWNDRFQVFDKNRCRTDLAQAMGMKPDTAYQLIEYNDKIGPVIDLLVDHRDEARIEMMRTVKEGPPENGYRTFEVGETMFIVVAIGPVDEHAENAMRLAMGPRRPMSFVKE